MVVENLVIKISYDYVTISLCLMLKSGHARLLHTLSLESSSKLQRTIQSTTVQRKL